MQTSIKKQYTGRKTRIGALCFDEGKMQIFVGYSTCAHGQTGKILINVEEAKEFSRRFHAEKTKMRQRLIRYLVTKLEV